MNSKQLTQANVLDKRIRDLKNQIDIWKNAEGIMLLGLRTTVRGIKGNTDVQFDFIDFERLREEALEALNQRLSEMEARFAAL